MVLAAQKDGRDSSYFRDSLTVSGRRKHASQNSGALKAVMMWLFLAPYRFLWKFDGGNGSRFWNCNHSVSLSNGANYTSVSVLCVSYYCFLPHLINLDRKNAASFFYLNDILWKQNLPKGHTKVVRSLGEFCITT